MSRLRKLVAGSYHRDPGSIPGQYMWYLLLLKWHWDWCFSSYFVSFIYHRLYTISASGASLNNILTNFCTKTFLQLITWRKQSNSLGVKNKLQKGEIQNFIKRLHYNDISHHLIWSLFVEIRDLFTQKCAVLQIGRSLVRSQMVSLEFSIDIILPIALCPWGRLSL